MKEETKKVKKVEKVEELAKKSKKDGDVEVVVVVEDGLFHKVVGVKDTSDKKVKEASKVLDRK